VTSRRAVLAGAAGAAILLAGGCAGRAARPASASAAKVASATAPPAAAPGAGPARRAVPAAGPTPARPRWPTFSATVSGPLTRRDVPFSWRRVYLAPPSGLRAIHLS
jgi:hypothetical protein